MISLNHKADCCGCSACESICPFDAITMQTDVEGFKYPTTDLNRCVNCGLCEKACPVIRYDKIEDKHANPSVYALHHVESETWHNSSSGGVFAALVDWALKQNGCVFGAKYNSDFKVVHSKAETWQDALAFRGSKYVQSDMGDTYKQVREELKKGRVVLFSGTPCQCEGLRGFLRKTYEKLLVVDIMCHCVPSPKVFSDYISFVENKAGKKISSIFMKDKTFGWGNQSPRITFQDGSSWFNRPETHLWNQIFYSQLVTRPSCYECRFCNYLHPGDITIGDFWGVEQTYPDFYNKDGISLLFANTAKGKLVFNEIKKDFEYIASDTEHCIQPNLIHPVAPDARRNQFWNDYQRLSFRQTCVRYFGYGLHNQLRRRLSSFIRKFIKL